MSERVVGCGGVRAVGCDVVWWGVAGCDGAGCGGEGRECRGGGSNERPSERQGASDKHRMRLCVNARCVEVSGYCVSYEKTQHVHLAHTVVRTK